MSTQRIRNLKNTGYGLEVLQWMEKEEYTYTWIFWKNLSESWFCFKMELMFSSLKPLLVLSFSVLVEITGDKWNGEVGVAVRVRLLINWRSWGINLGRQAIWCPCLLMLCLSEAHLLLHGWCFSGHKDCKILHSLAVAFIWFSKDRWRLVCACMWMDCHWLLVWEPKSGWGP